LSGRLTIVMYHYVRDFRTTRYPRIKGLDVADFTAQVDYLARYYVFVTAQQCWNALDGIHPLPDNAVLLTFDDGYADHYEFVFPILKSRGIQGLFFAPARPITEKVVLDVNKIHYILACTPDHPKLLKSLMDLIKRDKGRFGLKEPEEFAASVDCSSRYDTPEVILIKRLLQWKLPLDARTALTDELFCEIVTPDERRFAGELYLNLDQMRLMASQGMDFGHHGFSHQWLTSLSPSERELELEKGLELLASTGLRTDRWTLSYPYGAYDNALIEMAISRGCVMAVTTVPDIAQLEPSQRLTLARLDTNDLPRIADAPPNEWTRKVIPETRQ